MTSNDDDVNERGRRLLQELYDDKNLDQDKTSSMLKEFRIITREKTLNSNVLDGKCINHLVTSSAKNHVEAQKCLSNIILNYVHLRDIIIDPYLECFNQRLKEILDNQDSLSREESKNEQIRELLYYDLRIMFLISALCPASREKIRDRLLEPVIRVTMRLSDDFSLDCIPVLNESLKTLFNLTLVGCVNEDLAAELIKKLFGLVHLGCNSKKELDSNIDLTDELLVNLIHLLTNMPGSLYSNLVNSDVDKILDHLDKQLRSQSTRSFRDSVLPVLNVCANICKYNDGVRKRWFEKIIGPSTEFEKRPEEYDTLRGKLVKLMTSVDVNIKDMAAEFLYALCESDTEKFITYTGFGNSAAFLSSRGLLAGNKAPIRNKPSSEDFQDYQELRHRIDPITGKLDTPRKDPMEGVSEEEKEYYANELADAITKLTNLGVVKPAKIDQEGRITDFHPDPNGSSGS